MILKRRTRGGQRRYGVRVDIDGRQVWIGTFDKLADARRAEARARDAGRRARPMTCEQWVTHWLPGYAQRVKDSTYATTEAALAAFRAEFGGVRLDRLDRLAAEKWARSNRHRVPAVVTCLNAAVEAERLIRNPFAGLSHRGPGRKHVQPLTAAEVDALAQAAEDVHGEYGPTMRALVTFLAYSAMRPGEVFALEWSDIDFERMRIKVQRRRYKGRLDLPKSNRPRLIVLTPPARDALLTLPRTGRLVFTGKRGGPLSQSMLSGYWALLCAAAFPGRSIAPYELRHFGAHYLYVTMGLPARVVAVQLGHDGPKLIEQLYGHGDVGALEEIDAAFSKVVSLDSRRAQSQGQ